jgi:chromosome segregation ATPase
VRRSRTSCAAGLPSYAGLVKALNPLLFPPALIKRALDDLNAVGDAARRVGGIERALLSRLDGLATQVERLHEEMDPLKQLSGVRSHLEAVRTAVEPVAPRLDLLRDELRPIQEMSAVRSQLEAVHKVVEPVAPRLDLLRDELRPIQEMSAVRSHLEAVRAAVEPLDEKLDQLREEIEPIQQLGDVRAGIKPLDDDMRQVRESIDEIEPLVKEIGALIGGLDEKLGRMSGDLAPVGELAEKMPGVKRR